MLLVSRHQDELYSLAFVLTYDHKTARKCAIKAFEKVLSSYYDDSNETKLKLYKTLLSRIGAFSVKKKQCKDKGLIGLIKKNLGIFDKKVFILKYEFNCSIKDISYLLDAKPEKVKKSLYKSTMTAAAALEDKEDEM